MEQTLENIVKTDLWNLFQDCITYGRLVSMYSDTDKNYRMYNGNQWYGLKCTGIEPVQLNYIKPIVDFKVGKINSNLWAVIFSNEFYESEESRTLCNKLCKMINKKISKVWEKDGMDYKIRAMSKDAAINDEGVLYVYYNKETKSPTVEILNKNDVYYGNENNDNINQQPYIIIKKRMSVVEARNFAEQNNVSNIDCIVGDNENLEEAGEDSKIEKDPMITVLTKFYKKDGKVHYETATRYCVIEKDTNTGLKEYPVIHMNWNVRKGSARGEGVVRNLIPNQIEINKILMRRALVAKNTAYPQKVVKIDNIVNKRSLNEVGSIIEVSGQTVDDIRKVFNNTVPAQMSTDVEKLQSDLIKITRELEGAGDIATGSVNPEDASGKAILAVQRASAMPLDEQAASLKCAIECLARIIFDMILVYSEGKIKLEEEQTDANGEIYNILVEYPTYAIENMNLTLKIDITPKGAYDRYAQELSLENLLKNGFLTPQKLPELKAYAYILDDDATMNKQKLLDAIKKVEDQQRQIAEIEARTQAKIQRAQQFINGDLESQSGQLIDSKIQNAEQLLNNIKAMKQQQ